MLVALLLLVRRTGRRGILRISEDAGRQVAVAGLGEVDEGHRVLKVREVTSGRGGSGGGECQACLTWRSV